MNYSTSVLLINPNIRVVRCEYDPDDTKSKVANYFKTLDPNVKLDDLVVVPTRTRHNMTVVRVKEVDVPYDINSPGELPWIVQRVNVEAYEKVLEEEKVAIEAIRSADIRRQREELGKALLNDNPALAGKLGALSIAAIDRK